MEKTRKQKGKPKSEEGDQMGVGCLIGCGRVGVEWKFEHLSCRPRKSSCSCWNSYQGGCSRCDPIGQD